MTGLGRRAKVSLVIPCAAALLACGGEGPPSASGKGVVLYGTVLGSSAASAASARSAGGTSAGLVVTVEENPAIQQTVGPGSFTLRGLPEGSFTLVFSLDGNVIGNHGPREQGHRTEIAGGGPCPGRLRLPP